MTVSLMRIPQKPEKNSTLGLTGLFRVGLTAEGLGSWLLGGGRLSLNRGPLTAC